MKKNILIADDSNTILRFTSLALRFYGHTVRAVRNGQEAVRALENEAFDIAMIDLVMPELDGCELLARINNNDRTKTMLVIVLTEEHNIKLIAKANALGVDDIVIKPFSPQEIIEKVEGLLRV